MVCPEGATWRATGWAAEAFCLHVWDGSVAVGGEAPLDLVGLVPGGEVLYEHHPVYFLRDSYRKYTGAREADFTADGQVSSLVWVQAGFATTVGLATGRQVIPLRAACFH